MLRKISKLLNNYVDKIQKYIIPYIMLLSLDKVHSTQFIVYNPFIKM